MNVLFLRRIGFTVITGAVICFLSPVSLPWLGIENITQLEFLLLHRDVLEENSFLNMTSVSTIALTNVWFVILIPLMVCVPGLFIFADSLQGFWRMEYIRTTKRLYRLKKFISVCALGSCGVPASYLLYILIVCPFYPDALSPTNDFSINAFTEHILCKFFGVGDTGMYPLFLYILLNIINVYLFSFLTATICLCIYLTLRSRYKAVGLPIISYYLLMCISTAMFNKSGWDTRLHLFSPLYFIASPDIWFPEAFGVSFFWLPFSIIVVIFGMYVLYVKLLMRRIEL